MNNLDEYLNNLQSSLDDQLARISGRPSASQEKKYCPECGTQVEAEANFCPECGYNFITEQAPSHDNIPERWNESDVNEGIIWTDSAILADKYGIDADEVLEILEDFISENEDFDLNWHLLDMADYDENPDESSWRDYSEVLQQFIEDEGIDAGPHLSLFIIGGNDVIPQPAEANPCEGDDDWDEDSYDDHVYADFYYCFYGDLQLDFLDFRRARCNVARLPLESGEMETTIEEDIQAYFNRSNAVTEEDGINIGRAVMTSNSDWIPASREMSRNLPTEHMDNEEEVVMDNMFLSPNIMADMDEDLSDQYFEKLSEADMLVFNLHGSSDPDSSGFYSCDLAFSIDMLEESNARIFNTVACWGGRYIKYPREQSMLLSAIYNGGVLLYCGSCVPALGKCGHFNSDETWRIQPAAYSETFMARFAEYECLGTMTAGEAFLKAKCDYYNSSRQIEEDEYALATVLMFNLYGNPKLRTKPDVDALADIQEDDGSKYGRFPFRKMKRKLVMTNAKGQGSKSILAEVRGLVDSNLRAIHDTITKNLYNQLGVEPRDLSYVESYETTGIDGKLEKGYLYNYNHSVGPVQSRIQAKVDRRGKLIDAIQTKAIHAKN